jgi:hypothetical protein
VTLSEQFSGVGDDLLNCFHLLLCAVDLVYTDLRSSNKLDFLNPEFGRSNETRALNGSLSLQLRA